MFLAFDNQGIASFLGGVNYLFTSKQYIYNTGFNLYSVAMTLEDTIQHAGGVTALAKALGVTRAAIYQWQKGVMPQPAQRDKLKEITNGEFDFSCLY